MVYDEPESVRRDQARAKVASQFARAEQYVAAVDAAVVVPSAGPPCFLDDELFGFNMIEAMRSRSSPIRPCFLNAWPTLVDTVS
ncbi:MAG: hypothetical protein EBQ57_02290 [Actinobacteria bacterium]|nr:hypothetical protein [Actinomycetota bacterium]